MTIRADVIRGHTDAVILAQLLRRDSYGYEINKTIETCSGGEFVLKEATLYTIPAAGGRRIHYLLLG